MSRGCPTPDNTSQEARLPKSSTTKDSKQNGRSVRRPTNAGPSPKALLQKIQNRMAGQFVAQRMPDHHQKLFYKRYKTEWPVSSSPNECRIITKSSTTKDSKQNGPSVRRPTNAGPAPKRYYKNSNKRTCSLSQRAGATKVFYKYATRENKPVDPCGGGIHPTKRPG